MPIAALLLFHMLRQARRGEAERMKDAPREERSSPVELAFQLILLGGLMALLALAVLHVAAVGR